MRQRRRREELPPRESASGRKEGGGRAARWLSWRRRAGGAWSLVVVSMRGYRGTNLVLHASGLQVRRITVHGNVRLSSGEVQAIVDGLRGSSILTADLPGYRRRLMESPWVADVALRRVLPSTVEVFVSERRPMGLCRLGSSLYLDRSARHADRRVRPAVRGVRPADHRRPGRLAEHRAGRRSTRRAPSWRRA
mgnify:CR=1 FL=1